MRKAKKTTKPKAKTKLKRVQHDESARIELSPLRGTQPAEQQNVVCIVKVRKPGYVPDGFTVRTWIDDTLYTADCTGVDLQKASKDPNVESISPAERVRQIG